MAALTKSEYTRCIKHAPDATFLLFREDLLAICRKNKSAAAALAVLEHQTNLAISYGESEWVKISQQDICEQSFNLFNRKTINGALQKLRDWGFLLSRNSEKSLDHTQEHRLNLSVIQEKIDAWKPQRRKGQKVTIGRAKPDTRMGSPAAQSDGIESSILDTKILDHSEFKGDSDLVDNPIPPQDEHVSDHGKLVEDQLKTDPVTDAIVTPSVKRDRPADLAKTDQEPPSVPAVSPVATDAEAMIDALAAACVLSKHLHSDKLLKAADGLIAEGFTPTDVVNWRADHWPKHWKVKTQDEPYLSDVTGELLKLRKLAQSPTTPASTGKFADDAARWDDRPNPYAAEPGELPPRNIEYLEEYDPRFDKWNAAKDAIAITNPKIDGWLRKFHPIGIDADGAIVIEVATDEARDKFQQYKTLLQSTMNIRQRGSHKPDVTFVVVVKGDAQYRITS